MSDFVTCSEPFNIYSEGYLSQLWNTVGRLSQPKEIDLLLMDSLR